MARQIAVTKQYLLLYFVTATDYNGGEYSQPVALTIVATKDREAKILANRAWYALGRVKDSSGRIMYFTGSGGMEFRMLFNLTENKQVEFTPRSLRK